MDTTPTGPPAPRTRARALGIEIGTMPPGPTNSIVDVANVKVGHETVWFDEASPPAGRGVARTGVTAVVPFSPPELFEGRVPVGAAVLNGAGELTGFLQAQEWGSLETPILLTRTMGVGRIYDGVVEMMLAADPAVGAEDVVIPTVGECDDSWLSDGRSVQVEAGDVARAVAAARGADGGPVLEGAVGAGTGMVCLGFKGGIGSASRARMATPFHVSALANFGDGAALTVDGVPVGREFVAEGWQSAREAPEGSCIVVLATDAPLSSRQLQRLATRAGLGLARTGSVAHHGSGEIFVAFSTGARMSRTPDTNIFHRNLLRDEVLNPFFAAAVEATEEAVINCLVAADTVTGRDGHVATGIPLDRLTAIMRRHGRLHPKRH